MNKKKTKAKKLNMARVEVCIVIIAFIIGIIVTICQSNVDKSNKNLTVLWNNKLIDLKNEVLLEDDAIYFSKDDVKKIFDKTIYYNEVEKELITTYDKNIASVKIGEETAEINDEVINIKGRLKERNNLIYIPLTDFKDVYSIELYYCSDNNRVVMASLLESKTVATVSKKTKVKKTKNAFSGKVDKVIIGDEVTVLDQVGNKTKVKTYCGNIGYIKTKYLKDIKVIREKDNEELPELNVIRKYGNISGIYGNVNTEENKLNVVNPVLFTLDKNSKVTDKSMYGSATYSLYEGWATSNSLSILPTFSNNELVSNTMLNYKDRSKISLALVKYLKEYGFMGVNIEFTSVDDINSFYRFIIEVTPRLKEVGLKVAVTLNDNIDRKRIENIVDYVLEK